MTPATLPKSSKKVLEILYSGCEMTQKDLVMRTNLNPRTVRYAVKKLKERDVLIEKLKMNDLLKFGMIVIGTLPLMIAYPFVQKHFVKGVMIGSIKG